MGSKYPVLRPSEIIKVLDKLGFQKVSQRGSHVKFRRTGNPSRSTIIPMHDEVAKGTLKSILEQPDISLEEFLRML
jgi:predicted RNA binding protein YcfA (HicA-like mRNA interferase family)